MTGPARNVPRCFCLLSTGRIRWLLLYTPQRRAERVQRAEQRANGTDDQSGAQPEPRAEGTTKQSAKRRRTVHYKAMTCCDACL